MDFFDVIKNFGSLVAVVLSCVSLGQFLSKRIDKLFNEYLEEIRENDKKQTEEITEIKDALDNLEKRFNVDEDFNAEICRSAIKDIYYRYNKTQKIPLYERKMADSLYKIYSEQFHQNSYGQLLYQEICKWEIDTTDKLTM